MMWMTISGLSSPCQISDVNTRRAIAESAAKNMKRSEIFPNFRYNRARFS
jgi:hypothetical protein